MKTVTKKDSESYPAREVDIKVFPDGMNSVSDLSGDSSNLGRAKGGRPSGSTKQRKRIESELVIDAKNEITQVYKEKYNEARESKKMLDEDTFLI